MIRGHDFKSKHEVDRYLGITFKVMPHDACSNNVQKVRLFNKRNDQAFAVKLRQPIVDWQSGFASRNLYSIAVGKSCFAMAAPAL